MPRIRVSRRMVRRARPRHYLRRTRRTRGYKSTVSRSSFKSVGLPRSLSVKFPYYQLRQINPQPQYRHVILGNSLDALPLGLQGQVTTTPSTLVGASDALPPGYLQYAALYGTSNVPFSSWTIRVQNNLQRTETVGTDVVVSYGTVRVVALVCPYQDPNYNDLTSHNTLLDRITELDGLSFTSCCAQPYAKIFNLNGQNSGHETHTFKISRRTKTMLGIRSIKDRIGFSAQDLPINTLDTQPAEGWFIYIRQESTDAWDAPSAVEYDIKGTIYATLTSRAPAGLNLPIAP